MSTLLVSTCLHYPVTSVYASADSIWVNGKIYTADPNSSIVQAIAMKGDRIVYAGDNAGTVN